MIVFIFDILDCARPSNETTAIAVCSTFECALKCALEGIRDEAPDPDDVAQFENDMKQHERTLREGYPVFNINDRYTFCITKWNVS